MDGIQWISGRSLEDLKYVDDLAPLSHSFNHILILIGRLIY